MIECQDFDNLAEINEFFRRRHEGIHIYSIETIYPTTDTMKIRCWYLIED